MSSDDIRRTFLEYFEQRGHVVVPSSSLVPDDPSVLLTTAGMQQFKPYYTGEVDWKTTVHPNLGRPFGVPNVASVQKSFRTSDIDEVGDETHLTFFEMLGNFSFGGYFKEEAIRYAHEFITSPEWMNLKIAYVTVFEGKDDIGVPKDTTSRDIWKSLDPNLRVEEQGIEDVFWGPTGSSGPCGPTTEIYCTNAAGKDVEIWNIVFNEFMCQGSREELLAGRATLTPLKTKGFDTGMGLERLAMISQNVRSIYETDAYLPLIELVPADLSANVTRMLGDHVRACAFLISDGVRPSNKEAGYVLRKLMRRAIVHAHLNEGVDILKLFAKTVAVYGSVYRELDLAVISGVFAAENEKFERTLKRGLKELERIDALDTKRAFTLYESYGLPFEVIKEIGGEKASSLSREEFDAEFVRHQEVSRAGVAAKFGGHGLYLKTGEVTVRDVSELEKVTRLHTATHLLHAALRVVLGSEVRQNGSDITVERTRFDFTFPRKVTDGELEKIEAWVNGAIEKRLEVTWRETSYAEAIKEGALGFFKTKYPERVKVYTMTHSETGEVYSKELCGGPHVTNTGEVGKFRIVKEEAVGAGMRRIRAPA
ncbi:alanine--tRNA ligase, partial [Candidatus Uhrbacteria bacterium]|nr:alanine--tRNA ligase [Candidatus Uhrbacteria bacterium]